MTKRFTTAQFIERSVGIWGDDRWDYAKVQYQGAKTKVSLTCRRHDEEFLQTPHTHYRAEGCPQCKSNYMDQEGFIERAINKWGSRHDYSKVVYTNNHSEVIITCLKHREEFRQTPAGHLLGRGCRSCLGRVHDTPSFKLRMEEIWGDRWDLSLAHYTGQFKPVTVVCREHGPFIREANLMYSSVGCPRCNRRINTVEDFKDRSVGVWGSRWDYSGISYVNGDVDVDIGCSLHGTFQQSPHNHYQGKIGCKSCRRWGDSKVEAEVVSFIRSLGVRVEENRRDLLKPTSMEVDLYLPELSIAIEFNGVYWHSEKFKPSQYHRDKYLMCREKGIRLFQIWEDDWVVKGDIVKRHLARVVGMSKEPKISARDTSLVQVSTSEARDFLTNNHIQGFVSSSHYLGLAHQSTLVALATFKRRGTGDLELTRYATSANVRGGHSKLVSHAEEMLTYRNLVTFADLTFGNGDLYRKTGWTEDRELPPDYMYVKRNVREHKFRYRLKKFREDPSLKYVEGKTERELAQLNGLLRVYDAGKLRFIKPHPSILTETAIEGEPQP